MVVEGYVAGMHPSPYHGFSVEFAEHREYVPGDDIRHVDWKVWSKTDKLYLKQYEEETNLLPLPAARHERVDGVRLGRERLEAPVRAVRRGVARLHGPAAAGLGRPGDVRRRGPPLPQAGGAALAPEGSHPPDGRHAGPREVGRRGRLPRPGRALQEAGGGGGLLRPLRRGAADPGGPEALPPPPPRGHRLPHPRPGRARVPLPRPDPVQGAGGDARRPHRAARPAPGVSGRDRRVPGRDEARLPDDGHRLRAVADRRGARRGAVGLPGLAGVAQDADERRRSGEGSRRCQCRSCSPWGWPTTR